MVYWLELWPSVQEVVGSRQGETTPDEIHFIALIFAIPPLVGFGEYKQDASEIWYVILIGKIVYS